MSLKPFQQSLTQPAYSATQVLSHEQVVAQQLNIPMFELMKRAGASAYAFIQHHYPNLNTLLIVAGKGNNGGDGFIVARLAKKAGIQVQVMCLAEQEQLKGDALIACQQAIDAAVDITFSCNFELAAKTIKAFDGQLIVDAIFGIGFKGELNVAWCGAIQAINSNSAATVSIDVPSGLCATTGTIASIAVNANYTLTFIVYKQGLLTGQAAAVIGELFVADLGVGEQFIASLKSHIWRQASNELPQLNARSATAHKGSIGLALAVGGNTGMPGAIRLAGEAALRCGASLVAVCCHKTNQVMVANGRPELMLAPSEVNALADSSFIDKAKVILVGPGLGQNDWAQSLFECVLSKNKPMVIDADALRLLSQKRVSEQWQKRDNWVLAPHPGEAACLLGIDIETVENDRFAAAKQIVELYGGICVLKGAGSLITDGKVIWVNNSGNAGMASGGMGDVLSGIIAALTLQSPSLFDAARLAVNIHGRAADQVAKTHGQRGMLASDLFSPLVKLVNR